MSRLVGVVFVLVFMMCGCVWARKNHFLLVSTVLCDPNKCSYNYAAEIDVFRAYHALIKRGVPKKHIIMMTPDNFTNHEKNPWRGKLYNNEHKEIDLHEGVRIDYTGEDVTRENILAVLMGDKERVSGGSGRVIRSSSEDNIFMFLAGHGDLGSLMMPNYYRVSALDMQQMIQELYKTDSYKHFVLYIMACMSGSLFTELDKKYNTLVLTSSNATELSKALPGVKVPEATGLQKMMYFGTEFGDAWLNALEKNEDSTIGEQIKRIQSNQNMTSHPSVYGRKRIKRDKISSIFGKYGEDKHPSKREVKEEPHSSKHQNHKRRFDNSAIAFYESQLERTEDEEDRNKLQHKIKKLKEQRKEMRHKSRQALKSLKGKLSDSKISANKDEIPQKITNLKCHDKITKFIVKECPEINKSEFYHDFFLPFAALCEDHVPSRIIINAIMSQCH